MQGDHLHRSTSSPGQVCSRGSSYAVGIWAPLEKAFDINTGQVVTLVYVSGRSGF